VAAALPKPAFGRKAACAASRRPLYSRRNLLARTRRLSAIRYAAPGAPVNFEWDPEKNAANREKHGISFDEASTAFFDPLSSTIAHPGKSDDEFRFVLIGLTFAGRLVVVSHVDRGESVRLISARLATRRERRDYEQEG
jgi:uncharacterized DUF497 family protein